MKAFEEGRCYTRRTIAIRLGGSTQNYLPHKNKHVVCGCFRADLNPEAPSVVLPGNTDDKKLWADVFASQTEAVPVFLRQATSRWQYMGLWRCRKKDLTAGPIKGWGQKTNRDDISMILELEKMTS